MRSLLQHWITDQAMQYPDSIAVTLEGEALKYKDLDIRSNQLARLLKGIGCKRGDRICLLMPKIPESLVCMGGILKADCIYVPLDPGSSAEKLSKIVHKCAPQCLLAAGDRSDVLVEVLGTVDRESAPHIGWLKSQDDFESRTSAKKVNPVFFAEDIRAMSSDPLTYSNSSEDPARISFSGQFDGEPKGVVTSHHNNLEFIRWAKKYFDIQAGDHLSNYSPPHSDQSTFDILGALSAGAQLYMVPETHKTDPGKIADFISDSGITQWFSSPDILSRMARSDLLTNRNLDRLKRVIWSGRRFPTEHLRYWMEHLPDVSFTNLYSSKETTIASCYYTVPSVPDNHQSEIPIGKPCDGETLYLLDDNLNPVPTGEVGELYISGAGVSQGYWNDEDETQKKFQFNPYAFEGDRVFYKTGDLAYAAEDGCYYPSDSRKVAKTGNNIDVKKIENAINSLQVTAECAVVTIFRGEHSKKKKICCAFVPRGTKNRHIAGAYIALKLNRLLPDEMIPQQWESYVILPKRKDGEIDRTKLRKRFMSYTSKANANSTRMQR